MKYACNVTLEFVIESDADSLCDMEWEIAAFIQEHIMDDEYNKPIVFNVNTLIECH